MSNEDATSPSETQLPNTRLGRFILLEQLGTGRFGEVWRAYDEKEHRAVALKMLKQNVSDEQRDRFQREAQQLELVSHPSVVKISDVGIYKGRPFVVMDAVSGTPLNEWTVQNRGNWRKTTELFAKLAEGLVQLHQQRLIHRGLSPSNIFVRPDDQTPIIMDFGDIESSPQKNPSSDDHTVCNRAPELLNDAQNVDFRVDVFSLGSLLHKALTSQTTVHSFANSGAFGNIPPSLMALCQKAQADNPADRPDAAAIAAELRCFLEQLENKPPYFTTRALFVAATISMVAPVGTFFYYARHGTLLLSPSMAIAVLAGFFSFFLARRIQRNFTQ